MFELELYLQNLILNLRTLQYNIVRSYTYFVEVEIFK